MKSTKHYFLTGALAALMLTIFSVSAFADQEDQQGPQFERGQFSELSEEEREELRAEREAEREEINAAIESGDYDAWYDLISEKNADAQILEVITEDNFDQFAEAHDLLEDARELQEEAQEILEELGVEKQFGQGPHGPGNRGPGHGPEGQNGPQDVQ